jgi:hypothetical protein
MLVDISGFTKLSGKYASMGPDGLDSLQTVITGYLGQLVNNIYAAGGDVVKVYPLCTRVDYGVRLPRYHSVRG